MSNCAKPALAFKLMKPLYVCVCVCVCFPSSYRDCEKVFASFILMSFFPLSVSLLLPLDCFLSEQLPADLNKMHLTDHAHQQVMHMAPSQSGCSIASDSGSSSLSDIYQVLPLCMHALLSIVLISLLDCTDNPQIQNRWHICVVYTNER